MALSRNGKLPGYTDSSICPASYEEAFACRDGKTRNGSSVTVVACQSSTGEGILISKTPDLHDSGFYIQKIKEIKYREGYDVTVIGLSSDGNALTTVGIDDDSFMIDGVNVKLKTCSN